MKQNIENKMKANPIFSLEIYYYKYYTKSRQVSETIVYEERGVELKIYNQIFSLIVNIFATLLRRIDIKLKTQKQK